MQRWLTLAFVIGLFACSKDVTRTPVPQEDVLIVGRLTAAKERAQEPGHFDLSLRLSVPESLKGVMRREGRPIPESEHEMVARVKVSPDSVCVINGVAGELSQLRVGEEVVVVPVSGSCAMVGDRELLADAAEVYEFRSYQVRFLPKSVEKWPSWLTDRQDPRKVNSSGKEVAPIPIQSGRVLYFSAGLLPPLGPGQPFRGAVREGMVKGGELLPWVKRGGVRPYRTEHRNGSWRSPEPLIFPGLQDDASVRVTWVKDDDTSLLAELEVPGRPPQLVESFKDSQGKWGQLVPVPEAVGNAAGDGQRFGTESRALVWTVYELGSSDLILKLSNSKPGLLEPRINTVSPEWAPRVGPQTTLYFCRGDRQLLFAQKTVQEVRLPGTLRRPLQEAAPTADGKLLFFSFPRYAPGEPDWDLAVSPWEAGKWGPPTPLDD